MKTSGRTGASTAPAVPSLEEHAVLWAIDPEQGEVAPDFTAVQTLARCSGGLSLPVQPVFVGTPADGLERPVADAYVRSLTHPAVRPPEIVIAESHSRHDAVARLLQEASRRHSPLIAVSSHGRRGPSRWLHGSFAESLLERSPVPLLFLTHHHPDKPVPEPVILFATDFSLRSREAFQRIVGLAHESRFGIVLFYNAAIPIQAAADVGLVGAPAGLPSEYLEELRGWGLARAGVWVKEAEPSGVPIETDVRVGGIHVATGILEAATRHRVALIAVESSGSQLARALLGSASREVLRENAFPVWVYGPGIGKATSARRGA